MFAPVCSRFTTYAVPLEPTARAYVVHLMSLPAMLDWGRGAAAEVASADFAAPVGQAEEAVPERLPDAIAPVTLEVESGPPMPVAEAAPKADLPPPPPPRPPTAPPRRRPEPPAEPVPALAPLLPPSRGSAPASEPPAELRHVPRAIPSTIMVKPIGDGTRRRR